MKTLVLGIGNTLLGDEGVGVHVVRYLEGSESFPPEITLMDGGTHGMVLLGPMQEADRIVMVDAVQDGNPPGSFRRLTPRYSSEYPVTLTAHDIGLKDLLDCFYLMGEAPDVTLFAVSIPGLCGLSLEMSREVQGAVPGIAQAVMESLSLSRSSEVARPTTGPAAAGSPRGCAE